MRVRNLFSAMRIRFSLAIGLPLSILMALLLPIAPAARAEYVVLRSGQRLTVTSYQLLGDKYRLQLAGGSVEVPAAEVIAIEPEEVFVRVPAIPEAKPLFRDFVEASAARYRMDADLLSSVIAAESNFNPKAVSRKNARGLMQLLPQTAIHLGVRDIFDPKENIDAGAHYLSDLLKKYNNNLPLALAAYNAGPEKVQLYGRVPPYAETISYVRRVQRHYEQSKSKIGNTSLLHGNGLSTPHGINVSPSLSQFDGSVRTDAPAPQQKE
jgi:soluble lytic murein transglycosylase-like protein